MSEIETKFLGIKPMNIPADKLELLNYAMTSKRYTPVARDRLLTKISGRCVICGGIPTQIASYDCAGATRIERYCDSCVEKQFSRTRKGQIDGGKEYCK